MKTHLLPAHPLYDLYFLCSFILALPFRHIKIPHFLVQVFYHTCLTNGGLFNLGQTTLYICLCMITSPSVIYLVILINIFLFKDYYRIVNSFIELGRFKKAKEWEDWIERHVPSEEDFALDAFHRALDSCKFLGTDLVEVGDLNACCAICATYRKRIYSLSGADKRFPKFPKDFHFQCGLNISAFCDGISEPAFNCKN